MSGIYSDIFSHIQTYQEPCVTLPYSESWYIQNPGHVNSEPEAYSEPWYIENFGIFVTLAYLEQEPYLQPWYI